MNEQGGKRGESTRDALLGTLSVPRTVPWAWVQGVDKLGGKRAESTCIVPPLVYPRSCACAQAWNKLGDKRKIERVRNAAQTNHAHAQGVNKLGEKRGESKCALVFGQMNEPPGARARVALTGLAIAEHFRDHEGQDVLLFVDNIFRFTQARRKLPSHSTESDTPVPERSARCNKADDFGSLRPAMRSMRNIVSGIMQARR